MLRFAALLAVTFLPPHAEVKPGPGAGHDPQKRWTLVAQTKDGGTVAGLSQDECEAKRIRLVGAACFNAALRQPGSALPEADIK